MPYPQESVALSEPRARWSTRWSVVLGLMAVGSIVGSLVVIIDVVRPPARIILIVILHDDVGDPFLECRPRQEEQEKLVDLGVRVGAPQEDERVAVEQNRDAVRHSRRLRRTILRS